MSKEIKNFKKSLSHSQRSIFDSMLKKGALTPYVLEESEERLTQLDVFSKLMKDRIIFFSEEVTEDSVSIAMSQLLYMSSVSNDEITFYIMSPGGDCYSGLSLFDTMKMVQDKCPISTVACGLAASMGSILLCGGTIGKRYALPHTRVMIHQVSTGGDRMMQATDLTILTKETNKLKDELIKILADTSERDYSEVADLCERDTWLLAEECLPGKFGKKGLIDSIITKLK